MKRKQNLYLIYNKTFRNWRERLDLLSTASEKLGINVVLINAEEFDYSNWEEIPAVKSDMFYNVTPFSHEIENIFIHKELTSFFIEPNKINHLFSTHQFDLSLINNDIPIPKTIFKGTNNRNLLEKYVHYLGGFPLILKVTGGTTGIGVIKIETWTNLISTIDFLNSKNIHFQLKEFIENKGTIRVIVVGNKVITAILRKNLDGDFRCSGESDSNFENYKCTPEVEEIAIKASISCNFEFVGLDIITDEKGRYFVLEVNYPNNFAGVTLFNEHDIAFDAINHLKIKSEKVKIANTV